MQSTLNMQTIDVCPPVWSDFRTYNSPDSILLSMQSPGDLPSSGDLWFPCFLSYTVVSKQAKHLHKQLAHTEPNNGKLFF